MTPPRSPHRLNSKTTSYPPYKPSKLWLVLCRLGLNVEDLTQRTLKFFGPGSEYDTPVNNPYREKGGRPTVFLMSLWQLNYSKIWWCVYINVFIAGPRPQLPIEGPWRQGSLKSFLKNIDAGKEETGKPATSRLLLLDFWILADKVFVSTSGCEDDCQIDGIAKLAPIVAFYAGKPEMLEKVEDAVRVTQNNDACVAETLAAARWVSSLCVCLVWRPTCWVIHRFPRFLEHFILNGPDPVALESVLDQLRDPNRKHPQDLDKAVIGMWGPSSGNSSHQSHGTEPWDTSFVFPVGLTEKVVPLRFSSARLQKSRRLSKNNSKVFFCTYLSVQQCVFWLFPGHIHQVKENLSKTPQELIPAVFPNTWGIPNWNFNHSRM